MCIDTTLSYSNTLYSKVTISQLRRIIKGVEARLASFLLLIFLKQLFFFNKYL